MLPWAHPSPNPKQHLDQFSRFCTDHIRVLLYFTTGCPFPLKISSSHGGSGPSSSTRFLGPIRAHNTNDISIGSAIFAQMTAECPYTLQWDAPFPLKIASSHGDLHHQQIHGFLGPLTASQSVQPFSQGYISVTDRQTDHTTQSVTIHHIHIQYIVLRHGLIITPHHTTPQPFYGPFSGTTRVSQCQKKTSGL